MLLLRAASNVKLLRGREALQFRCYGGASAGQFCRANLRTLVRLVMIRDLSLSPSCNRCKPQHCSAGEYSEHTLFVSFGAVRNYCEDPASATACAASRLSDAILNGSHRLATIKRGVRHSASDLADS